MNKKENKNYEKHFEDVLIKLRRKYGKDELVASLIKENSEAKIELGKANSYIEELEDRLKTERVRIQNEFHNSTMKEDKFKNLQKENSKLKKENSKKQETINELIGKINILKFKQKYE